MELNITRHVMLLVRLGCNVCPASWPRRSPLQRPLGFIGTSDRRFLHPRRQFARLVPFFRLRDIASAPVIPRCARRCVDASSARKRTIATRGAEGSPRGRFQPYDLSIGEPKRERRLTICVRIKAQPHPSLTRTRDSVTIVREETHEIRQPKDEHREEHDDQQVHRRSR